MNIQKSSLRIDYKMRKGHKSSKTQRRRKQAHIRPIHL